MTITYCLFCIVVLVNISYHKIWSKITWKKKNKTTMILVFILSPFSFLSCLKIYLLNNPICRTSLLAIQHDIVWKKSRNTSWTYWHQQDLGTSQYIPATLHFSLGSGIPQSSMGSQPLNTLILYFAANLRTHCLYC